MGCASYSSRDLGLAFACTIGAGLASVFGALIVLFFNVRNNLFLAAAVSFASGVMIYISFCDIYIGKAVGHFADAGSSNATAFLFATVCFFCGMPIAVGLDHFGDWIIKRNKGGSAELPITSACGCHAESAPPPLAPEGSSASSPSEPGGVELTTKSPQPHSHATGLAEPAPGDASTVVVQVTPDNAKSEAEARRALKLVKVGLLAALAVGFHNAPEGLVTFVSYLNSISAGVTTAIAIAIHNIPEVRCLRLAKDLKPPPQPDTTFALCPQHHINGPRLACRPLPPHPTRRTARTIPSSPCSPITSLSRPPPLSSPSLPRAWWSP